MNKYNNKEFCEFCAEGKDYTYDAKVYDMTILRVCSECYQKYPKDIKFKRGNNRQEKEIWEDEN